MIDTTSKSEHMPLSNNNIFDCVCACVDTDDSVVNPTKTSF